MATNLKRILNGPDTDDEYTDERTEVLGWRMNGQAEKAFVLDAGGRIQHLKHFARTSIVTGVSSTIRSDASLIYVNNTSGGTVTLTSTPEIAVADIDGQMLILVNVGANSVVFTDNGSSGVDLGGASTLTFIAGESIGFVYVADRAAWVLVSHSAISGGGGGTVDTIDQGDGIVVDDSTPAAPIVSVDFGTGPGQVAEGDAPQNAVDDYAASGTPWGSLPNLGAPGGTGYVAGASAGSPDVPGVWLVSALADYIADLIVDAAPGTMDTLNELAAALGDDPDFAATVTAALAGKASLAGNNTFSGLNLFSELPARFEGQGAGSTTGQWRFEDGGAGFAGATLSYYAASGDTQPTIQIGANGVFGPSLWWGAGGSTAPDSAIYRNPGGSGGMNFLVNAKVTGIPTPTADADAMNQGTLKTGTYTLTNKRVTKRVGTVASSATPTINTDNVDVFRITALAAAMTSMTTNLSGTPTDGQELIVTITDDGTPRALTFGATFQATAGLTLPATTVASTRLYLRFIWSTVTSKWELVSHSAGGLGKKRVLVSVGPGATPTLNTDNFDMAEFTALAAAITSMTTNLSGTASSGQSLIICLTDNGTARAITWGSSFEASGNVPLPTTTVISARLTVAFLWNTATNKWTCVGVA